MVPWAISALSVPAIRSSRSREKPTSSGFASSSCCARDRTGKTSSAKTSAASVRFRANMVAPPVLTEPQRLHHFPARIPLDFGRGGQAPRRNGLPDRRGQGRLAVAPLGRRRDDPIAPQYAAKTGPLLTSWFALLPP